MDEKKCFDLFCKLFFAFLLVFTFSFGIATAEEETVSAVIVPDVSYIEPRFKIFSEPSSKDFVEDSITNIFTSFEGYAGEFTPKELEVLKADPRIIVQEDREYHALLDSSVPQVRGNDTWNLEVGSTNLTGALQTVCVLDTGVNYSHSAFGGCYGNNTVNSSCTVIGGWDFVNDDEDPMDDNFPNGHGTHVTGIVASGDSTYRGVSYGSKIVHVKVLDSSGIGGTTNVVSGIDWCVNNASLFNISVITMSLGDDGMYDGYCTSVDPAIEDAINAAVAAGIPVVVASGNCEQVNQTSCIEGVSYPACLTNATAVGSVYSNDTMVYMRSQNIFQLFAPGFTIVSIDEDGTGFATKSGTSMSAPHVAASMAVLQQFSNLQDGVSLSHSALRNVLNNTGLRINDTYGTLANFTRINIYSALLSLDGIGPTVSQVSPLDNHVNVSVNQTFSCNATDWQLENITLQLWNSSGIYLTNNTLITGASNSTSFSVSNIPEGAYNWNCLSFDALSNSNFSVLNSSITIGGVSSTLSSPEDVNYTRFNETEYICNSSSEATYDLSNVTLSIWNVSSGSLIYNASTDISGLSNSTSFDYNFSSEGNYSWNCLVLNNGSNSTYATNNFTISFDITSPVISSVTEAVTTTTSTITWTTDEGSNSSVSGSVTGSSSTYVTSHSVAITGLSSSTAYSYDLTSCDRSGNCANTSNSFTTSTASSGGGSSGSGSSGSSSGGGGGSSTSPSKIDYISNLEFSEGVSISRKLSSGNKVSFELGGGNHTITIGNIGINSAGITVESDPINLVLFVFEEVKLNITSPEYYDLYLRLNSIEDSKVNLTIQKINESINLDPDLNKIFHALEEEEDEFNYLGGIFLFIVLAVVISYIFWGSFHSKKLNRNISHGKKLKGNKSLGYHRNDGKDKKATIKALGKR